MKDESKSNRILSLYDELRTGKAIDKAAWAKAHNVCERSVRRDLDTIQQYLSEKNRSDEDIEDTNFIRRKGKGRYGIANLETSFLNEGELLAICKILIESRAFGKEKLQSLLERLLQSVISEEGSERIQGYISNELFNYLTPAHKDPEGGILWAIAQAIENRNIIVFSYTKMGTKTPAKRRIRPVGILFSEYYFYLMGIEDSDEGEKQFQKTGPRSYRLDRISKLKTTEDTFKLPYSERFKEGEYKNRVQFMYGGEVYTVTLQYFGPSVEAVLDRLPTAKITEEEKGTYTIRAEVAGPGILMWLLSQGSRINVLSPAWLREKWLGEMRAILDRES